MSTENDCEKDENKAFIQDAVSDSFAFAKWIGEKICRDNWFRYDDKVGKWYVYLKGHLTTQELYELYLIMIEEKNINETQNPAFLVGAVSGCLYAFLYNSCIHESSWATVSLHYSKEGAEKAMQEHKQKALDEFNELYSDENDFDFKFGEHEDWCIETVEVLP